MDSDQTDHRRIVNRGHKVSDPLNRQLCSQIVNDCRHLADAERVQACCVSEALHWKTRNILKLVSRLITDRMLLLVTT